jgi:4-hydroxy-tetrahydrodipicolinate reductase
MGREVVRAVSREEDIELVAAVDRVCIGEDVGELAGLAKIGPQVSGDLGAALQSSGAHVAVDFTSPDAVMPNASQFIQHRVAAVVGTTGLSAAQLQEIRRLCEEHETPCLVAPNFAIGAVLMMRFCAEAARHFAGAEIIELHHDQKRDAPSGTALRTAQLMVEASGGSPACLLAGKLKQESANQPSRGQEAGGVRIHSVRLPGLVAHQEVIFGGLGQTLTIRHDSTSRECFMPGVLVAIRKVRSLSGLVVGLENLL